jgi:hypothetical protein
VVVARKTIEDPISHGAVMVDGGVNGTYADDSAENYLPAYTTVDVRGDLGAFLATYHLEALFALCCLCAVLGGAGLLMLHRSEMASGKRLP